MSDFSIPAVIQALKDIGIIAEQVPHVSTDVGGRDLEPSIAEMRAELLQMKQQIDQTSQNHSAMCKDLASLHYDVHTIRINMAAFNTDVINRLKAIEANATARLVNSWTIDTKTPLRPLRDSQNQILPGFPRNYEAVETMSDYQLTMIFERCGLETSGDKSEKEKRLGRFTGMMGLKL